MSSHDQRAGKAAGPAALRLLNEEIHACTRCPRLAEYLEGSRRSHPEYWSRPVSGFGDPHARLFILGLAPGFHGANRHGRVFTGDDSGRWLWGALHELGVCSVPNCTRGDQPVELRGVYISNAARCVPPQNRPTTAELTACRDFLARELGLLPAVTTVLALGRLSHDSYLKLYGEKLSAHPFAHGAVHHPSGAPHRLVDSYHPSRQNTNTGVLTREMWLDVIRRSLHPTEQVGEPSPAR
ncbi:MAG: uracil-DNA glycosylase [Armatimonadota bacterium]